jgi:hypothetical protein
MMLMVVAMTISAATQLKANSLAEQDIGYQVATLSVDGQAVVSFDAQWNIVDLQTPVMLNMEVGKSSVQVVDAYSVLTQQGEISMRLDSLRWPYSKNEMMNHRNNYTCNYAPDGDLYSFTSSRANLS